MRDPTMHPAPRESAWIRSLIYVGLILVAAGFWILAIRAVSTLLD